MSSSLRTETGIGDSAQAISKALDGQLLVTHNKVLLTTTLNYYRCSYHNLKNVFCSKYELQVYDQEIMKKTLNRTLKKLRIIKHTSL